MSALDAALSALKLSESVSYAHTAKEFGVDPTTLARRHQGKQLSRQDATLQYRAILSKQQTKDLIDYINKLTVRGCPPTPAMVRNFCFDISKRWPGKNWVARFRLKHKEVLLSRYLKGHDQSRKKADNTHRFEHYFKLVGN